jgi:hypothetical protein
LSAFALPCAAAALAGSASGERTVVVAFAVRGNPAANVSASVGKTVSFVARAPLRRGDRLQILARRGAAVAQRNVATCALSPCPGHWSESTAITDRFQAVLKRAGRVIARSRTIAVAWKAPAPAPTPTPAPAPPPAPPPPPAPAATPGHYEGRTSQNEIFAFDVSADSARITGLHTGQINQSCNPPDYYLSGGYLNNWSGPLARDGTFNWKSTGPGTVGGNQATFTIVITGRIGAGTASGTIRDDVTWAQGGTTYNCSSGDQTWTATKTA